MPRLGLLALTSISEAFPLVIGESYASGLPVLTTDVGACRMLVEGSDEADPAPGSDISCARADRLALQPGYVDGQVYFLG